MKRIILILLFCCPLLQIALAQENPAQKQFVIKKVSIFDHEKLFTNSEIQQLDSIIGLCWQKGIADISIVTLEDRHTSKENFDNYVIDRLTAYASGEYGKNNGVVIAISKKLGRMRIQNGYGIEKILSDEDAKEIVDKQLMRKFKEEKYFEGTLNGVNTVISYMEKAMKGQDFTNVSSIFTPSIFKKISAFVLENGEPQTFRDLDSDNPSYNFTSLDVFLGPSRKNSFVLKDFLYEDYYEMTIRDNDSNLCQFIYFEKPIPEQTFIHPKMHPEKVYWRKPNGNYFPSDVWPLLAQIEDEMAQKSAVNESKPFIEYQWVLKQEFHPMERIYTDIDNNDRLSFNGNNFSINGENIGSFHIKPEERILSLKIDDGKQPAFAIFKMDDGYYYRYLFNKEQRKLYLVPLDEKEGHDLICVEGCTLLFQLLEK